VGFLVHGGRVRVEGICEEIIMRRLTCGFFCAALFLCGCGKEEPKGGNPPAGGVNVSVPGVNIRVSPDGGANVQAPGVNVKAGPQGAEVTAPGGVDVKASPQGVEVKAGSAGAEVKVPSPPDSKDKP
jgi:hypothetical protein